MIIRALFMILVTIIGSFPILQIPPKVMAQAPSEGAEVLVDDVIQSLKANDISRAQAHLDILNQQLPTFVNSTSLQSVKLLLDDVSSALKNNDVNNALTHLNLVKQQLTPSGGSTTIPSPTPPAASSQITNVQANHPPEAHDQNIDLSAGISTHYLKLNGSDIDGDPITYSILSNPTHGKIDGFDSTSGIITFELDTGNDSLTYQVTDSHDAKSNIAQVLLAVSPEPSSNEMPPESSISPPPSEPSTGSLETTTPPGVTNENPTSGGTDYSSICAKLQPVLVQSCSILVNSDGSLTSDGTHALNCIKNGILLGGGAALVGVPLSIILKGLSMLAAPTGCGDVVNMNGFSQLGDIGSLSSLTNLLP